MSFLKNEKDRFITQYRSILDSIKCKYCEHADQCDHICPEIKSFNIEPYHRRRLMNYIKKYYVVSLVIKNDKVYEHIIDDKAARGRFTDYAIRRMIKELIKRLIRSGGINPKQSLKLIINIDQQTTKSNGYYTLHEGLFEELKYGINNFNYANTISPILFGDLEIQLSYQESRRSYVVQAADLIAGAVRHDALDALKKNKSVYERISALAQYVIILP